MGAFRPSVIEGIPSRVQALQEKSLSMANEATIFARMTSSWDKTTNAGERFRKKYKRDAESKGSY